jgi:predicted RNA binding protein YcfA (HicA-like mRNA interferase family)
MPKFPKQVWDQLRSVTAGEIIRTLERDGFQAEQRAGSKILYRHVDGRKVFIHFHSTSDTFGEYILKNVILRGTSWTSEDLRRLKLIR